MKTCAEQRAYSRGYGRGRAGVQGRINKVLRIAKGWRDKYIDAYSPPRCDACARWRRGGNGYRWGVCSGGEVAWAEEPAIWAHTSSSQPQPELCTHENFGCVNWLPK